MKQKKQTAKPSKIDGKMCDFIHGVAKALAPVKKTVTRYFYKESVRTKDAEPLSRYPVYYVCASGGGEKKNPTVEICCPDGPTAEYLMHILNFRLSFIGKPENDLEFSKDYVEKYGKNATAKIKGLTVKDGK